MKAVQKGNFAVITQKCNKTANINIKKTAVYTQVNGEYVSKTAKITKRWYYSAAHWHLGDVLVGNITFFVIFAVLDVSLAINLCINCSFLHLFHMYSDKLTYHILQILHGWFSFHFNMPRRLREVDHCNNGASAVVDRRFIMCGRSFIILPLL